MTDGTASDRPSPSIFDAEPFVRTAPFMGGAEEYANLACFLASDAGSYVTGTAINVGGGRCPVV